MSSDDSSRFHDLDLIDSDKLKDFTPEGDPPIEVRDYISRKIEFDSTRLGVLPESERPRSPKSAKNIYEFLDLVDFMITKDQAETNKPDNQKIRFSYAEPDVTMSTPVISAAVTRREPAGFSKGSPLHSKVKQYHNVLMEEIEDPAHPGYRLLTFSRRFENIVTFTCWGRKPREANDRSIWFEKLMLNSFWLFEYCGVQKILYHGRDREVVEEKDNNRIFGRQLRFWVRTELISTMSERKLNHLIVEINRRYLY